MVFSPSLPSFLLFHSFPFSPSTFSFSIPSCLALSSPFLPSHLPPLSPSPLLSFPPPLPLPPPPSPILPLPTPASLPSLSFSLPPPLHPPPPSSHMHTQALNKTTHTVITLASMYMLHSLTYFRLVYFISHCQ